MGVGQSKFYLPQARLEGARAELTQAFLGYLHRIINVRDFKHHAGDERALLGGFEKIFQMIAAWPRVVFEFREEAVEQRTRGMAGIDPVVVDGMTQRLSERLKVQTEQKQVVLWSMRPGGS